MTESEKTRLIAWNHELRTVHERLREALHVTRAALREGDPPESASRELLLFCHGICSALTSHHVGEDRELFPAIAAAHPELRETPCTLEHDHSMIARLVGELQAAGARAAPAAELEHPLDGIAAIMDSHFRYEERQLLAVPEGLALQGDAYDVLGPL
ncbi:MAG: hemerythrin domain-containing protein [Terracoccus sp.]